MRKILTGLMLLGALLAFTFAPSAAQAQEHSPKRAVGKIGVGFTHIQAPIGVRMWFMPTVAFDANFGLTLNGNTPDVESTEPNNPTTMTTNFDLDLGVLIAIWRKADSQSSAFIRIGYYLDRDYADGTRADGSNQYSNITRNNISLMLGFEWFMKELGVPQLALQAAVGFNFQLVSPAHEGGDADSTWTFDTMHNDDMNPLAFLNATFGFHYYFF